MITPNQLHLLHHTLGLKPDRRVPYRNHFAASNGHHDYADLVELERVGMMTSRPLEAHWGGGICFYATDAGKAYAIEHLPPAPKKTRYDQFLDADCGLTFAEWLGIEVPKFEYADNCYWLRAPKGYVRMKSSRGVGEWCPTYKEAKASYKQAIKARRLELSAA